MKLLLPLLLLSAVASFAADKPNVIVVITDDQGYGDLSVHGNPVLSTPALDKLHSESIRLTDFHVAPMCTPTRGQLLTGMDAARNGATNVSSGRTLLSTEFPTMANYFQDIGYATGIFGKWHLGDNYPYRPVDRGFQETLWFPSSHIGSTPDTWNNDYFDDTYIRNGKKTPYKGYTTDVFFDEAIKWIKSRQGDDEPFFCYIPTAAPHWPWFVPEKYRGPVRESLNKVKDQLPPLKPQKAEDLISFLAMIANADENVGKLDKFLHESGLAENTILIYLTDNGSTKGVEYFNAGMRGKKTTLWEGGHRVPCFVRWPKGNLGKPRDIDGLTEVQDLLPTLRDLCNLAPKTNIAFDGMSLAPVFRGNKTVPEDRTLIINYSRMPGRINFPNQTPNPSTVRREGAGVLWKRWRLLQDKELYNLDSDPKQQKNVIADHPKIVARMRGELDHWWEGVKEKANQPQHLIIRGDAPEDLTACEWFGVFIDQQVQTRRADAKTGYWHLDFEKAGKYRVEMRRYPEDSGLALTDSVEATKVTDGEFLPGKALPIASGKLEFAGKTQKAPATESTHIAFEINAPTGRTKLRADFLDESGDFVIGAYYLKLVPID